MKGFKSTGNGPRYGNFTFSSRAGFGPSSGAVKNVSGYTRRAPKRVMKKAIGGLVEDNIVDTPGGPADFAKGGKVSDEAQDKKLIKSALQKHIQAPAPRGHKGLGKMMKGSTGFNRTPKIGK